MMLDYKDRIIDSLQKLIAIPSVKYDGLPEDQYQESEGAPFGKNIEKALEYTLSLCEELGFRTKNCNGYVGYAEIGEGDELFAILTHLDVVPEGHDWTYPPFGGEIHDGKLYGRGAIDDKCSAITSIYAVKALMDKGVRWNKRVRLIFGVDEEKTWKDMEYYVANEEQPTLGFTPDASFPAVYCEKEILHFDIAKHLNGTGTPWTLSGGTANNAVPDSCILECGSVKMETEGTAAHGSRPWEGKNAVTEMMNQLQSKMDAGEKLCTPELEDCVRFYQKFFGETLDGSLLGIDFRDEISGGTTFNVGKVRASEKEIRFSIDIRMPLSTSTEELESIMTEKIKDYGYQIENDKKFDSVYFEKDSVLLSTLVGIYRKFTGDTTEPILMGGGTFARAIKNIVAFGPRFPGREETEHRRNEYIFVDDLMLCSEIYAEAVRQLATDDQ